MTLKVFLYLFRFVLYGVYMCRARNNPKFFEPAGCFECGEMDADLMKHKYTDELLCVDCVNKKIRELEIEENEGEGDHVEPWEERGFNSSSDYANFITRGA